MAPTGCRARTAPLQSGKPATSRSTPCPATAGPPKDSPGPPSSSSRDWDAAWRNVKKALPPVEPAVRPLDSRAARQAAARAGAPPSPQFSGGRNDRQGPGPAPGRPDPAVESIRAQERVALDVWSDARFAAAGGAVAGVMLLVFLAKADF